jgi:branched-chain amino acid transport system substrate-binding protein
VNQLNENGGVLGKEVELVTADSAAQPSEANSLVQEMINQDGIQMLCGTIVSEVTLSLMDLAAEFDLPFFSTGAASPRITKENQGQDYERYKNHFRPGPVHAIAQAKYLAQYGQYLQSEYGYDTMAVVSEDAAWTQPVTDYTADILRENGITVEINQRVALDTSDWAPILDDVESSGAQVMIGALSHIPITGMVASWSRNEYPFTLEGIMIAAQSPQFLDDTGSEGMYLSTATSACDGYSDVTEHTSELMDLYQSEYDERPTTPTFVGFITYDTINLWAEACERAGTADHTEDIDAIVEELQATDYTGTYGRIQFYGPDAEYPNDVKTGEGPGDEFAPWNVTQWQPADGDGIGGTGGTKRCIWPDTVANGEHMLPPWME